jgi:hypothetical protein
MLTPFGSGLTLSMGRPVSGGCGTVLDTPSDDNFDCGSSIDIAGTRFSGATLWTPFNLTGLATAITNAQASSLLTISASADASLVIRGWMQDVGLSGDFRIRVKQTVTVAGSYHLRSAGLFLREGATGKILTVCAGKNGPFKAQARRMSSATVWGSSYNGATFGSETAPLWLEVERSGSLLSARVTDDATDGNDLTTALAPADIMSVEQTVDFTTAPTQIGLYANGQAVAFDWIKRLV